MAHINDDATMWAQMWNKQVQLGCIPYYMFVVRDTGAQHYFGVPLVRAANIFKEAYSKAIASPYLRLDVSYTHIKTKTGVRVPVVYVVTEPKKWNLKRQDVRISLSDTKEYVVGICYIWKH